MYKILPLLLLIPLELFSQNYRNIASPGMTYFSDTTNMLRAWRLDSVVSLGADSVFYSFRVIRRNPDSLACSDIAQGPVLCRVMREKPNGDFIFLDRNSDSLLFKTGADLNESWTVRPLPGGKYITASVTAIGSVSFLGIADTVKTVTFMARNQDGTVSPHIINGVYVLLSKSYGFVQTIDFNLFPNDTSSWRLVGKSSPSIGIQDFDARACFDFNPGDVFHYRYLYYWNNIGERKNIIQTILQKNDYGDSVTYVAEECTETWLPQPPPNHFFTWDTITLCYVFAPYDEQCFYAAPDEFKPGSLFTDRHGLAASMFNDRQEKRCAPDDYSHCQGCWKEICSSEDQHSESRYARGIGKTYDLDIFGSGQTGWHKKSTQLVYFVKGAETWGTALNQDCHTMVGLRNQQEKMGLNISVVPNPVVAGSVIRADGATAGKTFTITLLDFTGRFVCQYEHLMLPATFPRTGLKKGFYLLLVKGSNDSEYKMVKILMVGEEQ